MSNVPQQVPARMVNEFVYCPRLFFLEWVDGLFAPNADTVEGEWRHRRVDREQGAAPLAGEGELNRAQSLKLGSDELGLIAVVDVVEGACGPVMPVDTKKGHPPAHGPVWQSDVVQLCVQGLLLREHGYRCERGELYYAETNERRTVEFDDELVALTLDVVRRLRETCRQPNPPAPLIDSPKCPRCSLVGICLPDEVNALADRSPRTPRRLVPHESSAQPMYVTEHGVSIGISSGRVRVTRQREVLVEARLIDVSQINVMSNAQVSTQLIRACFRNEIPVCWFSNGGWFQGIAEGLPNKNVELRRRQFGVAHQAGLPVASAMIEGKIRNCRTLLRRNERTADDVVFGQLKGLAARAREVDSLESLLGVEGTAARLYFSRFATMLRADAPFDFEHRNRRPPRDRVNCLLSLVYSLLVKDLTATAFGVGLDPYYGVYHKPRFGRPAVALDLAEEFRPLVADSVVINVINNGEVRDSDFLERAGAVSMTKEGRKSVIAAYERRLSTEVTHPVFGYRVTYRRVLEVQARLLAAFLMGEVADYVAFTTR